MASVSMLFKKSLETDTKVQTMLALLKTYLEKELISFIIVRACATDETLSITGNHSGRAGVT